MPFQFLHDQFVPQAHRAIQCGPMSYRGFPDAEVFHLREQWIGPLEPFAGGHGRHPDRAVCIKELDSLQSDTSSVLESLLPR